MSKLLIKSKSWNARWKPDRKTNQQSSLVWLPVHKTFDCCIRTTIIYLLLISLVYISIVACSFPQRTRIMTEEVAAALNCTKGHGGTTRVFHQTWTACTLTVHIVMMVLVLTGVPLEAIITHLNGQRWKWSPNKILYPLAPFLHFAPSFHLFICHLKINVIKP